MARTLEDLEKATQIELDSIAVSHQRLEVIRQERDALIAAPAAPAAASGTTIAVPAAKFKAKAP